MKETDGDIVLFREMITGESFPELPENDINQAIRILSGADAAIKNSRSLR